MLNVISRISKVRTIDSFKIPAYRTYFLGLVGMWGAFGMEQVARTYLMYEITGSTAMLGVLTLTNTAPILVLALFGGAIADRVPKKLLIRASHAGFMLIFLCYAIAWISGYMSPDHPESWWVLLAGSFFMGTFVAFSMPARGAIVPEIVDRDRLMNAISLTKMGMSFFQMVAPIIAGYLIGSFGYTIVFFIMVGLNLMGLIVTSFLPKIEPRAREKTHVLTDIKAGFNYVLENRTILLILVFFVSSVLLVNPLQTLMPVFAKDILNVGVEGQGTMLSLMGLGSIGVTFLLASFPVRKRGITMLVSNIWMGATILLLAFSVSWPLSMAMMVLIGIGRMGSDTCGSTLIQAYTDPTVLGRVNSIVMVSFGFGGAFSFVIGLLAETIGTPWAIGMFAILLIVTSSAAIVLLPRIRNLD